MPYRLGTLHVNDQVAGPLEVEGDGYAAAGEPVTLVGNARVRELLQVTADEGRDLNAGVERFRDDVRGVHQRKTGASPRDPDVLEARREAERLMAERLGADRWQRLLRLSWRVRDADALLDPEVSEALGITAEQRSRLDQLYDSSERKTPDILGAFKNVRLRSNAPIEALGVAHEQEHHERLKAVLTAEQRAAFDRLKSEAQP